MVHWFSSNGCVRTSVCVCVEQATFGNKSQTSDQQLVAKKCILDGGVGCGVGEQIFVVRFRNWQAGLGGQFSKKKNAVCEISPKVT